jgi:membrane protein
MIILKRVWSFLDDEDITLWSAGMTFFTLFSTVPLLIFMLSLFTNMPIFQELYLEFKNLIFDIVLPQKSDTVISYIDGFLQTNDDIGLKYFIYIFIISMLFFKDYEAVVGKIFNKKSRGYIKIFTIYITLIIVAPIVFGYFVYLSSWLDMAFASYLLSWGLFFILYNVASFGLHSMASNLKASFVSSLVWFVTKIIFVYYITYSNTYATLYGSISILFIVLFWIYLSWAIYLYGLKLIKYIDV